MKRLFALLIFIMLVSPALSQEIVDIAKNASSNKFKTSTNQALNKEIDLPDWANFISNVIFGAKDKVPLSKFIILSAVWILLFLMILNVVKFMPFFKEGASKWLGAIAITLLIAISGVIIDLANGLINFANSFSFFKEWSAGAIFFSLLFIIILFFLIIKISNKIMNKVEIGAAQSAGEEAGQGLGIMRVISRVFNRSFKK